MKSNTSKLNINTLLRLKDLFDNKGWEIDENVDISFFNRYIQTLKTLDEAQQSFFLELSSRFLYLPIDLYLDNLIKPLETLRDRFKCDNLLFACCLPKEDIGRTKSAHAVLYQIKGTRIKTKIDLMPYFVVENLNSLKWESIEQSRSRIILVDDFIGTGETALNAIEYVKSLFPNIESDKISILSIVAMEDGVHKLQKNGYEVFYSILSSKGISDFYHGIELDQAIKEMESIEFTLKKLDRNFRFGYKRSEALVCMERCPNNTFPIYWKTKKIAPYER